MSFGRKGIAPGQAAMPAQRQGFGAAPRPAAPIDPEAAEIAARREAFLAAERSRREELSDAGGDPLAHLRNGNTRPATRREDDGWNPMSQDALREVARRSSGADYAAASTRSYFFGDPRKRTLLLAYVYWYFCAPIGLHRIYCGHKDSGFAQAGLFFGAILLAFIWLPMAVLSIGVWFVWILADLFLIPGMMRRFKAEMQPDYGGVFA